MTKETQNKRIKRLHKSIMDVVEGNTLEDGITALMSAIETIINITPNTLDNKILYVNFHFGSLIKALREYEENKNKTKEMH